MTPSNRTLTCVICGDPIDESSGQVPVILDQDQREEIGDYDGSAYHLNQCDHSVFETVYAQVDESA